MAAPGRRPRAVVPRGPGSAGCSGPAPLCERPSRADPARGPPGPDCCLRRSVVSERRRRKRISESCERLRSLLPSFDGRREDAASVLEMAVQFLQLAGAPQPSAPQPGAPQPGAPEPRAVSLPAEPGHPWTEEDLQAPPAAQDPAGAPGQAPGLAAAVTAATLQDRGPRGGPPSPVLSPPGVRRPCDPCDPLGAEAASLPPQTARPVCDVDEETCFLLAAGPDWWPGSPPAASSLLGSVESSFVVDPEALEPAGLALGEAAGVLSDFLTY